MPQMKANTTFHVSELRRTVRKNEIFSVKEGTARSYDERGIAVRVVAQAKPVAKPAGKADAAPLDKTARSGFRTGAAKPSSSSDQAPAPRTRASTKPAAKRTSSASTKAGGSRRGRTSSTAATASGGADQKASPTSKA
jgi:hypothetical protein